MSNVGGFPSDEYLRQAGFEPPDPSKPVKTTWLMPGNSVMTFGEDGEQLVDLQGSVYEVIRPLHRRSTPETEWKGLFAEDPWPEVLASSEFWAEMEAEDETGR